MTPPRTTTPPGPRLLAVTIRQPWAWAITAAGKDTENRTWQPAWRGTLAIHAGKTPGDPATLPGHALARRYCGPATALGAIIAVAVLAGTDHCDGSCSPRWAIPGQWHWHLTALQSLARPVPARGHQGLWPVPPDLAAQITTQTAAAGTTP